MIETEFKFFKICGCIRILICNLDKEINDMDPPPKNRHCLLKIEKVCLRVYF